MLTITLTSPAVKLYISVEMLPVNMLPNTVRITTSIIASTGPSTYTVSSEKMLLSPIFAPGKNSGGNKLSTMNIISPMAVSTASVATRRAVKYGVLISRFFILLCNNFKTVGTAGNYPARARNCRKRPNAVLSTSANGIVHNHRRSASTRNVHHVHSLLSTYFTS